MIIVRGRALETPSDKRGATFTGDVWADPVLTGAEGVSIATITFTPGAHTFWHSHERGQILQVLAGRGYVCSAGEKPQQLRAGDTVWVPAGERHWHGAAPDTLLMHTAISLGTTAWEDEISEADYASAAEK